MQSSAHLIESLLPEMSLISSNNLRNAVKRIWQRAFAEGNWSDLASVPKNIDEQNRCSLIEHTRAVARIGAGMADAARTIHDLAVDPDRVVAMALLHDVSKVVEFEESESGPRFSEIGRTYQHAVKSTHWMEDEGLDNYLIHGVIAHTPWSKVTPRTDEAILVHYADLADSDVVFLHEGKPLFCQKR